MWLCGIVGLRHLVMICITLIMKMNGRVIMWTPPWVSKCGRLGDRECLCEWASHECSEYTMVNTKRSYCIFPKAHSNNWCIHTFNSRAAYCIALSSFGSMHGLIYRVFLSYFICCLILLVHMIYIHIYIHIYIFTCIFERELCYAISISTIIWCENLKTAVFIMKSQCFRMI